MSKRAFPREKEWIAPIALLSWAIWANCSSSLFSKEQRKGIVQASLWNSQKHTKITNILSNLLGFCNRFARNTSESLTSLFFIERQEQFAHEFEQKSKERMSQRGNFQPLFGYIGYEQFFSSRNDSIVYVHIELFTNPLTLTAVLRGCVME